MNNQKTKPDSQTTVIAVSEVSKTFGTRAVLKNISLDVTTPRNICICGPNGAGKSTLLRLLAGILNPDRGYIKISGFDIHKSPEKTKPMLGFISHRSMLYPDLTVYENLLFFARLYALKNKHQRILELLRDIELIAYRYDKTGILSRGMLQRLAIARALIHNPSVLLADEPFTGLDTRAVTHLKNFLRKFRSNGGTLLMTTHQPAIALDCCSRVIVLDKAKFILDSEVSEIDKKAFRRDYLQYAGSIP